MTNTLVVLPSVSAAIVDEGVVLDKKAVSGLRLYAELWPGRVVSVFREGSLSSLAFSECFRPKDLPFEVRTVAGAVPDSIIVDAGVILASGDDFRDLDLADRGRRLGVPVGYAIEYTLGTRLKIAALSGARPVAKAKSLVWNLQKEIQRREAFKKSAFIQSNGFPASKAYSKYADNLTYLDTRLSETLMATDAEIAAKVSRVLDQSRPLRLAYSGRLERMKGADHLLEVASRLPFPFTLDIYGSGSLAGSISDQISRCALHHVRLHDPVDFESELVPIMRKEVDLFLCCHVQSDPSCTYLETLGCAAPIVGYSNEAWSALAADSNAGWSTPIGRPGRMAEMLTSLHNDRKLVAEKITAAAAYGRKHSFEREFRARVGQLAKFANASSVRRTP